MYNTQIISKVYDLKQMILNSNEYKQVKEKEKVMEENCASILVRYSNIFNEYNEALRFKDYGANVNEVQKRLHLCKLELDENIYVKEYKEAYKKMNELLGEIEGILFASIIENKKEL